MKGYTPPPRMVVSNEPMPITRNITITEGISVKDLAEKLDIRVKDVISRLLGRGVLRLALVRLRCGEHHYEEGEQQSNKIRIRDQPPLVILVLSVSFLARHFQPSAAAGLAAPSTWALAFLAASGLAGA